LKIYHCFWNNLDREYQFHQLSHCICKYEVYKDYNPILILEGIACNQDPDSLHCKALIRAKSLDELKIKSLSIKILFAVFNVLFVGYSLAKNNLNNTYQYNMISKKCSKTMNYLIILIKFKVSRFLSRSV
jgi:hypothetical protein